LLEKPIFLGFMETIKKRGKVKDTSSILK